jgi:xenotropic and polytropic retrovirus receptor 1
MKHNLFLNNIERISNFLFFVLLKTEDESTRYVSSAPDTNQTEQETTPTKDDQPATTPQQSLEGSGNFGTPAVSSLGRSASSCQRKSIPSRTTISALTDVLWDEIVSQSSKKCSPDGSVGKQGVNRTKLRHAEKMMKGAFVELYKGLGYLATYR